jgi:hypothetical protein
MKSLFSYLVIVGVILTINFSKANNYTEICKKTYEILLQDSVITDSNLKQDQSINTHKLEDFVGEWKVLLFATQPAGLNMYVAEASINMIENNIISSTFLIKGGQTDTVKIRLAYNSAERDYSLTFILKSNLTVEGIPLKYSDELGYTGEIDATFEEEKVIFGATIEIEENKHTWSAYMKNSDGEKTFKNLLTFSKP